MVHQKLFYILGEPTSNLATVYQTTKFIQYLVKYIGYTIDYVVHSFNSQNMIDNIYF